MKALLGGIKLKNERQNGSFPFQNMMPINPMMFPNYMNNDFNIFENRISNLEKKFKNIENRIQRLENPYGNNNQNNMSNEDSMQYQTTQNYNGYNGEMYMM